MHFAIPPSFGTLFFFWRFSPERGGQNRDLESLQSNPQSSSQLTRSHWWFPLFHRIASPLKTLSLHKSNYKTDLAKACWLQRNLGEVRLAPSPSSDEGVSYTVANKKEFSE
ncbi:hypothetical protein CEXT_417931 [Caerostris extrusa]|uniref:Uncharacterized protein n=1 Tax=Caerostris extrusa TaxID=172846 RepID=A0AAV4SCV8_CAEEX|nr:hypothetical protein CEXT_417931 [Caerostris extrusa]